MYGVNPGAMAALGDDLDAAHAEFRQAFSAILKDLAQEANSLETFRELVTEFFSDTNPGYEHEWLDAVQAVRKHEVDAQGLPKVPAESPRTIEVSIKKVFNAADNEANLKFARAA